MRCFGYDPYNAKEFVERWVNENGPFGVEVVRQGARTESVPLGELKKLAGERMLLFDEDLIDPAANQLVRGLDGTDCPVCLPHFWSECQCDRRLLCSARIGKYGLYRLRFAV